MDSALRRSPVLHERPWLGAEHRTNFDKAPRFDRSSIQGLNIRVAQGLTCPGDIESINCHICCPAGPFEANNVNLDFASQRWSRHKSYRIATSFEIQAALKFTGSPLER
jgi:hypothetical protein